MEERSKKFVKKYPEECCKTKYIQLQALKFIHFDQTYTENPGTVTNADVNDLVVMGILGVFILSIACVNFINLATALAIKKSKEIRNPKDVGQHSEVSYHYIF